MYQIFIAGQLLGANRTARVDATRSNSDFSPHPKLATVSELRRCVVQQYCTVQIVEKFINDCLVLGTNRFRVP